ncbi:MAG: patatin-like phospholipase family protein, partial [Mesorhizobium sp.]
MLAQSPMRTNQAAVSVADLGAEDPTIDIVLANDAHGAFVWGALDRLLDEPRCSFSGVTASGFAAMEAAVFAYGLS